MARPTNRELECVICGKAITATNNSREHVIPNSIGGKLKTKGFIHRRCNNEAGRVWDNVLAEQLKPLCLFFGIVREKGRTPALPVKSTTGEEFVMLPEGGLGLVRPIWRETPTDAGIKIQIGARDRREARKMLHGVKRKYPAANIDNLLEGLEPSASYPSGLIHLTFLIGGEQGGRSIVKTAAAFAHSAGVSVSSCNLATAYLRNSAATPCFGYYYERDLIRDRPSGVPLHCVAVSGDPSRKLLFGYVEYFSGYRMIVCLSDEYDGPAVSRTHAIDPTTGRTLDLTVEFPNFCVDDIDSIYNSKSMSQETMSTAFSAALTTRLKAQFEAEKKRVISEAIAYGFKNCGAKVGEILTEEQAKRLAGLVAERMTPFLIRSIRMRNSR